MRQMHIIKIESLGLKKKYIASQINTDPSTLSRWLHGKGNLKQHQVEKLEELLQL